MLYIGSIAKKSVYVYLRQGTVDEWPINKYSHQLTSSWRHRPSTPSPNLTPNLKRNYDVKSL